MGTTSPVVSVLLCTYNQAPYLQQAIDSVRSQTFTDWELLIIDNGSTDGSDEIIMAAAADPRIDYTLYVENGPITQRLNAAVKQSRGLYISFLYGDDTYLPEKLAMQVAIATSTRIGIVYGPGMRRWPDGHFTPDRNFHDSGFVFPAILEKNFTDGSVNAISPLIRREVLEQYPFYEDLFVEGESMFLKYALSWRFQYLDVPLVVMREHDQNMGKAIVPNTNIAVACLDKLTRQPAFRSEWLPVVREFRAQLLARSAWTAMRMGADLNYVLAFASEGHGWRAIMAGLVACLPASLVRWLNSLRPVPQAKANWT